MSLNSRRMFKEIKELIPSLQEKYRDKILGIGIRYEDKTVDKAESSLPNLQETLWAVIDNKHVVSEKHKNIDIEGIFICDSVGRTLYDSVSYRPDKQKLKLMKDGDRRVLFYKSLPSEDKEKLVNIVADAIILEINKDDFLSAPKKDTPWGDMPWDFK